jgi:nitrite reductase (NO-forming)
VLAADRAVDAALPRITVVAKDVRFQPDRWTATAGRWTLVELRNDDPVVHDWMVEGIPNLEVIARPGQTASLRFVLDTPGEYMVMCSVEGHAEAGMVGMLVVEAP